MIDGNTCETLDSDSNAAIAHLNWEGEVRQLVNDMIQLFELNRHLLEKDWEFKSYYNSSKDNVQSFLDRLIYTARINDSYKYFASFHNGINQTGMYSMCMRYNVFDKSNISRNSYVPSNKQAMYIDKNWINQRLVCLLSNVGLYVKSKEKNRYEAAASALVQFSAHAQIAWRINDLPYKTQLPMFNCSYYNDTYMRVYKFWWLLTNNQNVSEYCLNLFLQENDMTMKEFTTKIKRFHKNHNIIPQDDYSVRNFKPMASPFSNHDVDFVKERLKYLGIIL